MIREETIFKMTESANELYSYGDHDEVVLLLQMINRLCDHYTLDMPDEGVSLTIQLNEKYGKDVLKMKIANLEG